jgi:hypothetical protein
MKTCVECLEPKAIESFYKRSANKDGLDNRCIPCEKARNKAWTDANPEKVSSAGKRYRLRIKYGLTLEQYESLLAAQGGGCACCKAITPRGRGTYFVVDHDHETGQIRGLLCNPCNLGIGALGDTIEGVERAARYLRRPPRIT